MLNEPWFRMRAWRALGHAAIVVLGLATIVGSGGLPCGDGPCDPFNISPAPVPTIEPPAITLQVGASSVLTVRHPGISNPTYRWWRAPQGFPLAEIQGATQASYTLSNVNLLDDGASFVVDVKGLFEGREVTATSAASRLAVSSMPPVTFQDSEFLAADWSVASTSQPLSGGPSHAQAQLASGGNPAAHRATTITMPAGPSRLDLFSTYLLATYDPASLGALYVVDFTQDCLVLPGTLGVGPTLLLEQNGRRYTAGGPTLCGAGTWSNKTLIAGHFGAPDFVRIDGPACAVGEACPDFSAAGGPIRFGFVQSNQSLAGVAGVSGGFGIDNWRVLAWRR
jgi:hypothetical protein